MNEKMAVFLFCFFFVGMPLGLFLGWWFALGEASSDLSSPLVKHVPKLGKDRFPFVVNLPAKLGVFVGKLLLKVQLLAKKLLLKSISKPCGDPASDEGPENGAAHPDKDKFVFHKDTDSAKSVNRLQHKEDGK